MKQAILVNGVPASGKSTLTDRLTRRLLEEGVPAVPLSLDAIKTGLFLHLGSGDRLRNRMLGRASYQAIFDTVAGFPEQLVPVIDAWHGFQDIGVVRDHLSRAGLSRVIEVWCAIEPATAAARYRVRSADRHPGHPPASYADELQDLAARATPLSLGPVVMVPTEDPTPVATFARIRDLLRTGTREAPP